MEKAGKEAETAEGEIYERVDGAEAGFDPDCGVFSACSVGIEKAEVITSESGETYQEAVGRERQ